MVLAFLTGAAPRAIGKSVEPYDAYNEQFSWSLDAPLLTGHCRILMLDCLPRLVAGHRLPGLEADPDPALLGTGGPVQKSTTSLEAFHWWTLPLVILALSFFVAAPAGTRSDRPERHGHRPANHRHGNAHPGAWGRRRLPGQPEHLQFGQLSVPGLALDTLGDRLRPGPAESRPWWGACPMGRDCSDIALVALFTCDAAAWYRRLGWVDERLVLIRQRIDDPALRWLGDHPEIRSIFGGYWDVYRLSFLSEGRVKGVPFPLFPNRFPEWSRGLLGERPQTLLLRPVTGGAVVLDPCTPPGGNRALPGKAV